MKTPPIIIYPRLPIQQCVPSLHVYTRTDKAPASPPHLPSPAPVCDRCIVGFERDAPCPNPHFHATISSPVGGMYMALEGAMSRRNEAAVFIEEAQRRDVLKGLFTNYYYTIQKDKLVFDTNRVWCAKLPALTQLFPKARIVCCVRDLPWIMDSIERLVRKNAFEPSGMFGFEPGSTVYARINQVA